MSKSLGNVISPQDVVKEYGADILRLWVASTDFRNDMAASEKILKQVQDPLAEALLGNKYAEGTTIKVALDGEKFTFSG